MYGYLNYIRSSLRLQKEASRNVEMMWLLRKAVPNFRCIADFRKDNAKAIKEVFKAFAKLCNKVGLLSQQSAVIDGTKFRAVNADKKSYVVGSAKKVLPDVEGKISQYMKELDEADAKEARPGALGKEDITKVLDYLDHRSTGTDGKQRGESNLHNRARMPFDENKRRYPPELQCANSDRAG